MESGLIHNSNPKANYLQSASVPAAYHPPMPSEEEVGSSIDFWGIVRRRFFLILFFILVALGLGTLYVFTATPWYESVARIQIIPEKPTVVNLGAQMFSDPKFIGNNDPLSASHPNAMRSTDVLNGVLVDGGLIRRETFVELVNPARPDEIGQPIHDYLEDRLSIQQDRNDVYMFELKFQSKYKEDSGLFLNRMIEVYRKNLTEGFRKDISESISKLEESAKTFTQALAAVEQELAEFRAANPVPKLDQEGKTEALRHVEVVTPQLQLAWEKLNEKRTQLELVRSFQEAGSPPSVILDVVLKEEFGKTDYGEAYRDYNLIEQPKAELQDLIVLHMSMREKLGPMHPRLKTIEAQIESKKFLIQERLKSSSTAVDIPATERLEHAIKKLVAEELEKRMEVERLNTLLRESTVAAERYAKIIAHEAEIIEKRNRIYENITAAQNSVEEVRTARNDTGYKFNVLNPAAEGFQVEPRPLIVFGIATVLGTLLGFGVAYLVDLADKTFRSPHEIIRALNLALIGHIPVIRGSKAKGNSGLHPVLCTFHKPKSQTAEAFRAVRTAIYFSTQGQKHQVIQVTSPTPGDGKSTLATNLAITIAQSGKRVLLVDGDMRRPSLHKLFKADDKPGFSDVLVEQISISEAIRETEVEGLHLLPCGVKPVQPSELLTSHRLPEVIAEFRNMYDMVIIDTPPVLVVTDPCPIAANVDGVICAMRIKKNVRVSAERMVDILRSVNANIIGVVVNGVGAQGTYSSQYSYGAYQSGYSNYAGYGYNGYGYGRYGQNERSYDDNRRPELALPKHRLAEQAVTVDQD
ncbi:MAG: polysaccharide biosynthesis tyrosine autokinase [Planctomycetaceae bacterium]|jgi:succinoglycan biosynthesis transport protein ExoP|nr:polysaccharide biosynthesis tyrosine autokinase [Planctomycetaceae bacterium]